MPCVSIGHGKAYVSVKGGILLISGWVQSADGMVALRSIASRFRPPTPLFTAIREHLLPSQVPSNRFVLDKVSIPSPISVLISLRFRRIRRTEKISGTSRTPAERILGCFDADDLQLEERNPDTVLRRIAGSGFELTPSYASSRCYPEKQELQPQLRIG